MRVYSSVMVSAAWLQAILARPSTSDAPGSTTTWDTPAYYPGSPWVMPGADTRTNVCHVRSGSADDSPAIIDAFNQCGQSGKVIFDEDHIYNVGKVMNITDLYNVEVDVLGTLLWSTDIQYWLNNSLPIGFQNQSTAFFLGGQYVHMHSSNGKGTFDGNGQVWYDFMGSKSNYPGRPHQITFNYLTDSVIERMRFVQSQMWTMALVHSENVLLQDIYVNSTDQLHEGSSGPLNTDGADTLYSNNITFARWTVDCGDDHVSPKSNSTNILVEDQAWYHGSGFALGSIGQYYGQYSFIENVTVRNVTASNSRQGAYIKTWTGVQKGVPPNGGGGGTGYIKNVTLSDFSLSNVPLAFDITQCVNFEGGTGDCDTSAFQISGIRAENFRGSQRRNDTVADLQCSARAPCSGIALEGFAMTDIVSGLPVAGVKCRNVVDPIGFACTS